MEGVSAHEGIYIHHPRLCELPANALSSAYGIRSHTKRKSPPGQSSLAGKEGFCMQTQCNGRTYTQGNISRRNTQNSEDLPSAKPPRIGEK